MYFYPIDILRFIAASMVAFFHLTWEGQAQNALGHFGWVGVQIFFVISGFVIIGSAQSAQSHSASTAHQQFLRSRAKRLYPAAFICALISGLILFHQHGVVTYYVVKVINSFFLLPFNFHVATAYWTLPIEISFYALMYMLLKHNKWHWIPHLITYLIISSALYNCLLLAYSIDLLDWGWLNYGYGMTNMLLLRHGVFFGLGMLLFLIYQQQRIAYTRTLLSIGFIVSSAEVISRAIDIQQVFTTKGIELELAFAVIIPLGLYWLSLIVIAGATRYLWQPSVRIQHLVRTLGLVTYPLYLLHEVIGFRVKDWMLTTYPAHYWPAIIAGYAAALCVSWVVAQYLERQLGHWLFHRKHVQNVSAQTN